MKYAVNVVKFDRKDYSPRDRFLVASNSALYVLDHEHLALHGRYEYHHITVCRIDHLTGDVNQPVQGFSVSRYGDGLIVVHTSMDLPTDKGDLIISSHCVIETVYTLAKIMDKTHLIKICDQITHNKKDHKTGTIVFRSGFVE